MLIPLLRSHLQPYRRLLLALAALQLGQVTATLLLPTLNADIIDKGALTGDTAYIEKMGAVLLGIAVVQVFLALGAMYCAARVAMGFGRDLRRELYHTVIGLSAREVHAFGAPSLVTRVTNDVQQIQLLVLAACSYAVAAPITIIIGTVLAVRADGALAILILVAVPILGVALAAVARRMHPQYLQMQRRIDRVNQVIREQITGMRVIRAFVREPDERSRFEGTNAPLTDASLKAGRLTAMMYPVSMAILNLTGVAAVWFGADRIGSGEMQIGSLVAFLTYLVVILASVMMSTMVGMMAPRAAVCAGRIQTVLDTTSTVVAAEDGVREIQGPMSLALEQVSFSYPGAERAVLDDVSARVDAGETLAIIGSTGSGKTALLHLVARLFDVTHGSVALAGTNVRDLDATFLSSLLGLVPQKPFLFSGTVATNLRFGRRDATDEELWAALEVAQAADFVRAMPDGLDTAIAQGGTNVSGGQRQRLAIARAVVHRPAIYLFDDSFSALDLRTDANLRAALRPVTRDAVTVVVAQRVSTITEADQILVLEEGRAVGLGTHAELLTTCPTYCEIVESQHYDEDAA
jgi:ATP-binding cassette subfamily B protein